MRRVHVLISGHVQGVFFRAETRNLCHSLGITGWVKNTSRGEVEAVFEGEEQKINKIIEFCHRGPSGAMVKEVKIKEEKYKGEFKDFTIRYSFC